MATDLPAPDLGAIRARHQHNYTDPPHKCDVELVLAAYDEREALLERIREDGIRLIAAYDAQAARLAMQQPIVEATVALLQAHSGAEYMSVYEQLEVAVADATEP